MACLLQLWISMKKVTQNIVCLFDSLKTRPSVGVRPSLKSLLWSHQCSTDTVGSVNKSRSLYNFGVGFLWKGKSWIDLESWRKGSKKCFTWRIQPDPRRRRRSCGTCSSFHLSPPHCSRSLPSPEIFAPSEFSPDFLGGYLFILRPLELCGVRERRGGRSYVLLWVSRRLLQTPPPPSSPSHLLHSPPSSQPPLPLGCNFPSPPGWLLNVKE